MGVQIFKRLLFIPGFILIVLLFGCGQKDETASSAPVGAAKRILGQAKLSPDLARAMKEDRIDTDALCLQVTQGVLGELPRLELNDQNCAANAPLLASYEMREFIDPNAIGVATGIYILYEQLLPVGEVKVEESRWNLTDLCSLDSFYQSACTFKVGGGRLLGIGINPAASTDRLRAIKAVEAINKNLKGEVDKHKAALVELNKHLQTLSTQIQSQREVIKTTLDAMEPLAASEEKKVQEALRGGEGKPGLEALLSANTKEIQQTSEELTAIQEQLAEPQKSYLEKEAGVKALITEREELLVKRSELKTKLKAATEAEEQKKLQEELTALESTIATKLFETADKQEDLKGELRKLQNTEEFKKASALQSGLAKLKGESGELQKRLLQFRTKANAIVLLKNHLATAKKLMAEQKLREVATLLPQLGRLVERLSAN